MGERCDYFAGRSAHTVIRCNKPSERRGRELPPKPAQKRTVWAFKSTSKRTTGLNAKWKANGDSCHHWSARELSDRERLLQQVGLPATSQGSSTRVADRPRALGRSVGNLDVETRGLGLGCSFRLAAAQAGRAWAASQQQLHTGRGAKSLRNLFSRRTAKHLTVMYF